MSRAESFAAFRFPGFRRYQAAGALLNLAVQTQGVAVAWQVYSLTNRRMDLGLVGLYQFIPIAALALVAGQVADRFNRKWILVLSTVLLALCSFALAFLSAINNHNVHLIYLVLFALGCARAFYAPAASTITPLVVPKEQLPSAIGWGTTIWQVTTIAGPAIGGLLYRFAHDAKYVYAVSTAMLLLAVFFQARLALPAVVKSATNRSWKSLLAGINYVRKSPVLLGAVSLDLFAVLLGGSVALLPVFARDILHVDQDGLGYLRAAPAFGAAFVALVLAVRPLRRHAGIATLTSVAVFGATTIIFGLSRSFWLSMAILFIGGAADMVSVFVRQNLRQLLTPDEMRGRVSAVTGLFVSVSNELGEFESGATAEWFGTVPSVVAGGVGTILIVIAWAWLFPALRKVDRILDQAPPGAGTASA
ncbi:MAG: MFS transporter [Sandaracinaceae bacterium]|nr:MFS transporter [Sandaracinaceae bacterium]